MKKLIIYQLLLFACFISSCSNEDIEIQDVQEQASKENILSIKDASNLLENFMADVYTKSSTSFEIKGNNVKEVYIDNTVALPVSIVDTIPIYEFITETDGQEGYAVVVADRRIEKVIASVPYGSLSDTSLIEPLRLYFRSIPDILEQDLKEYYAGTQKTTVQTKMTAETCYHFLPTIWGQEYPYNSKCPTTTCYADGHYKAGCIPIAVAQILAFHKKPSNLNWDAILSKSIITSSSSPTVINQVSSLIVEIGSRINIVYDCGGSGISQSAALTAIPQVIRSYGMTANSFAGFSITNCIQSLRNGYPILFMGMSSIGGHAWICDAWKRHIYDNSTYYDYLDMNWGWSGLSNGFFAINDPLSFSTDKANFNSQIRIITNIH